MDFSRDESFLSRKQDRRSQHQFDNTMDTSLGSTSLAMRQEQLSRSLRQRNTALNVQKSIQLLDESVASPSNRSVRTPGSLKKSNYTPRLLASGSKFDVSAKLGPTPRKNSERNRSLHRSFQEESFRTTQHGTSVLSAFPEEPTEDITTTNIGLLLEEDPGVSASRGLFEAFLECLQTNSSHGDMFNLVEEYEKRCREQSLMLRKLVGHATRQEEKCQRTYHVLYLLKQEEATWKLVMSLYKDRLVTSLKEERMMDDGSDDQQPQGVHQSDQKIAEDLIEREQVVREGQLVVDWLENCAQDDCDMYADNIKFFSDRAVGYENARHRLQNRRSDLPMGSERPLITELDPDAPIRQNKMLDDLDKEDEDRLLQYIFVCLRAGQLEKAQKMCIDCGQAWRAATLEGWKLFHDPNFFGLGPECQKSPIQGNPNRDIWKKVCWNMTQDPRLNTYERAIYSVLSGNLKGMLPVCKSWSDFMWAYFRVFVDSKVEDDLRLLVDKSLETLPGEYWGNNMDLDQTPRLNTYERAIYSVLSGNLKGMLPVCKSWSDFMWAYFRVFVDSKVEDDLRLLVDKSLETLPGEYWEKNLDTKMIFKEIEANEAVSKESHSWYHIIQKHIILGDTRGLLEVLNERLQGQRQEISMHMLRFMAHFVLFLRTAGQDTKESACNAIIEAYVEELIKEKQHSLVAFYVAKLPPDAQIHWYALFLEKISDKEERQRYLDLAEQAGLDLAQITKRVVENIRCKTDIDFTRLHEVQQDAVDMSISPEDQKKIESIDWLVFDSSQRAEAMKQANAVMRSFIALKKLVAAKEVMDKLPPNSVDVIHKVWLQQTGTTNLPQEDRNAIREYLCIKAYLDAMESFNDWFNHYHHGKPTRPAPPQGGSFTDKVAYEHRLKQFEQEEERWYHNLLTQTQTTKDYMYNVLLFADGGWMMDQEPESEEDTMETGTEDNGLRLEQMDRLRRLLDSEEDPMETGTEDNGLRLEQMDRLRRLPESEEDTMETGTEDNGLRLEQMDRLRRLVIPSLLFLLHNVLHTSEQYQECVRLSDIVTSEQRKLYEVFRKDELQRLLHLLRESSLKMLDNNCGPLGFELN